MQINYNPSVLMANNNDKTTVRSLIIIGADYNSADCREQSGRGRAEGRPATKLCSDGGGYIVCTGHNNPLFSTPLVPSHEFVRLLSCFVEGIAPC